MDIDSPFRRPTRDVVFSQKSSYVSSCPIVDPVVAIGICRGTLAGGLDT